MKATPLTPEQEERIDAYLMSRRSHSRDIVIYNAAREEDAQVLRHRLALAATKPTFVLFTNVLWDSASTRREIVFKDSVQWVVQTIQWFAHHPEKQLVIRIHPAEAWKGTNQPYSAIIASHFPALPANVVVIEPTSQVNSWSLIHLADIGLVHTSTAGLELPLEGVPCIVVSRIHYRGKGFTIDVGTQDEYFQILQEFDARSIDRDRLVTLAKRYAYLVFERYQLPFSLFHELTFGDVRALLASSVSDLLADKGMALVVQAIEQRQSFLLPD